jgi:GNAT superfamily N-acetyltransferase
MKVEYRVVRARSIDVPHLPSIELRAAVLLAGYAPAAVLAETTDIVHLDRARSEGRLWVALWRNQPVGFAHVELLEPGAAHLQELDVLPEHGRRGLGRALIAAATAWAARRHRGFVTLTTFRDVPWNMPFYQRLGFAEIPRRELSRALEVVLAKEARAGLDLRHRVAMRRVSTLPLPLAPKVSARVEVLVGE